MVWSIALANILGAGTCFLLSGQLAKVATLRWTLILPLVVSVIFVGAYQGQGSWGDLFTLVIFGVIGWVMKQNKWPRPPLILGFVLGELIERYMFISSMRYGLSWLLDPVVFTLLALAVIGLFRPGVQELLRQRRSGRPMRGIQPIRIVPSDLLWIALLGLFLWMLWDTGNFGASEAQVAPYVVGTIGTLLVGLSLANRILRRPDEAAIDPGAPVHMDMVSDFTEERSVILRRAAVFLGWLLSFMLSMWLIGFLPTVPLFTLAYMWTENREPLRLRAGMALGVTLFLWLVFEVALGIRWPDTALGGMIPWLAANVPSM
jgi:hypothetical protein